MKQPGQIVLFHFPYTDLSKEKLRPSLLLQKVPGKHDDWLICMISSQLRHEVKGFDEIIRESDKDFSLSGLKTTSLIRLGRIAVVEGTTLVGSTGSISSQRLRRVKKTIAAWIKGTLKI